MICTISLSHTRTQIGGINRTGDEIHFFFGEVLGTWRRPSLHGYLALLMSTAASFLLVLAIITQEGGWDGNTVSNFSSGWNLWMGYFRRLLFGRHFQLRSPRYFCSKNGYLIIKNTEKTGHILHGTHKHQTWCLEITMGCTLGCFWWKHCVIKTSVGHYLGDEDTTSTAWTHFERHTTHINSNIVSINSAQGSQMEIQWPFNLYNCLEELWTCPYRDFLFKFRNTKLHTDRRAQKGVISHLCRSVTSWKMEAL